MIEFIVILLISLPLIIIGCTISPDTPINFGTRIPKSELKSEEDIKRSKRIKIALMLAGVITLAGGISCVIFEWEGLLFWIMLIPVTIAVIYMLLQLYKIERKGKGLLVLMLSIIVILGMIPLIATLPIMGNDNNTTIRNDTLFIEGSYAKEIPIASITQVDSNATVPDIEMRTNGTSLGENNVGYFQTKEGKDVLLYLHSDDTNVTHIKTKNNEDIYINFKDSALSVDFPNQLKAAFLRPVKGK